MIPARSASPFAWAPPAMTLPIFSDPGGSSPSEMRLSDLPDNLPTTREPNECREGDQGPENVGAEDFEELGLQIADLKVK